MIYNYTVRLFTGFCLLCVLMQVPALCAYETDQFTVPEAELADMGNAFTQHVIGKIDKVILAHNARPLQQPIQADWIQAQLLKKIKQQLSPGFTWQEQRDGIFGLPFSFFSQDAQQDVSFMPGHFNHIYSYSGFYRILNPSFIVFCSTIKLYGVYLGADKPGHMFTQGFQYYQLYHQAIDDQLGERQAQARMVDFGKETENHWFGLWIDGVYSNADLAANMAGFYFYQNLFAPIVLNNRTYPALLAIQPDGQVVYTADYQTDKSQFLAKFFTAHLNEALNPSYYEQVQRNSIQKAIKKRCASVLEFYHLQSKDQVTQLQNALMLWNQQDYGYRADHLLRIDQLCY